MAKHFDLLNNGFPIYRLTRCSRKHDLSRNAQIGYIMRFVDIKCFEQYHAAYITLCIINKMIVY